MESAESVQYVPVMGITGGGGGGGGGCGAGCDGAAALLEPLLLLQPVLITVTTKRNINKILLRFFMFLFSTALCFIASLMSCVIPFCLE